MTLFAPACVLVLAEGPVESRAARRAIERALDDFEPVREGLEFLPNEPMRDRSFTEDPRRSSRRLYTLVAPDARSVIAPRVFDAAVLVVSARRSVSAQTRAHAHELACVHRAPLVLYITECAHPDALPDLVEIEARELLDSFAFDADAITAIRTAMTEPMTERDEPDEGARELIAWLDEHATVCPDAAELPFVGQILGTTMTGWAEVEKHQGRLTRGARVNVLQGAVAFEAKVLEAWDGVRAGRPSMGLGLINVRLDPRVSIDENWVVSAGSIAPRTQFDVALFGVERWIEGWLSSQVELVWGSDVIAAQLELVQPRARGLATARVSCVSEVSIVDRASCVLLFDGEPEGRAVVLPRL